MQHPSILTSFVASAQCPHSWTHMVSSRCQVSIGAGAQIAWRWPPAGELPVVDTDSREDASEGRGFNRLYTVQGACLFLWNKKKWCGDESPHINLAYMWMVIAKWLSDCRIGIIQLTLKCKFDILATMEILMRNLQISNTLVFLFYPSLLYFHLDVFSRIFCMLYILFSRGRHWPGDRESFTWLIFVVFKEEQREDRLGPRWTVCNVVSYS